jgi:hypothetical protein
VGVPRTLKELNMKSLQSTRLTSHPVPLLLLSYTFPVSSLQTNKRGHCCADLRIEKALGLFACYHIYKNSPGPLPSFVGPAFIGVCNKIKVGVSKDWVAIWIQDHQNNSTSEDAQGLTYI